MHEHRPARPRRAPRVPIGIAAALVVVAAACAGNEPDAGDEAADRAPDPAASAAVSTTSTASAPVEPLVTRATEATSVTDPPPAVSVADLPALVDAWGASTYPSAGDTQAAGSLTPDELVARLVGAPVRPPLPDGATGLGFTVSMTGSGPDSPWSWSWEWWTGLDGGIGDIDPVLDGGGPGTHALRETYDPVLAAAGWSVVDSLVATPATPGGPTVAAVTYRADDGVVYLGQLQEIDGEPGDLLAVLSEAGTRPDGAPGPTLTWHLEVDAPSNFHPVPVLGDLFSAIPVAPGAVLTDLELRSVGPGDDAGTPQIELVYVCDLLDGSAPTAQGVYRDELDGTVYAAARLDPTAPGDSSGAEPSVGADGVWRQPLLVLGRYEGVVEVITAADGSASSRVAVTLVPGAPAVRPPA